MDELTAKILVVDDNEQDLRHHVATLKAQGYEVAAASNAEEALLLVEARVPDLLLIAAEMQGMDGYALCERLKEDGQFLNVPVVFVIANPSPEELDRGYSAGGADYVVKPCHLSELLARVRTHVGVFKLLQEVEQLREATLDVNPLTQLPGANTIATKIQHAIDHNLDVCVIAADLDNFKSYNDHYGLADGDELLMFTAETLKSAMAETCTDATFLGHAGGDDFLMIVPAEHAGPLSEQIVRTFDTGKFALFSEEDAERGFISTEDRLGNVNVFPFNSLSLGGVKLQARVFTQAIEVAEVCTEVMHMAKRISGSSFFMDRRTGPLRKSAVNRQTRNEAAQPSDALPDR
jgi:CheY-like chemotaxis protein